MGLVDRAGKLPALVCVCAVAGGLAACGSDDSGSSSSGSATAASGTATKTANTLNGDGKELVFFSLTSADSYVKEVNKAAKAEAQRLGYKMTVIESPLDQSKQDALVRQFVASRKKPAAILWWPWNAPGAVNSTRQLARIAPLIQDNTAPDPAIAKYITASSANNEPQIGTNAAEMLIDLRNKLAQKGTELKGGPNGNLLILNFPPSLANGHIRSTTIRKTLGADAKPMKILEEQFGGYYDATLGYQQASQIIPKYKNQLDFVYVGTTYGAVGVAKALKENGLTPGKDVWIVSGNCATGDTAMRSGDSFATTVMAPQAEGQLAVNVAAQYLATGKVTPGSVQLPASKEAPQFKVEPPHQINFTPNVKAVGEKELDAYHVWGFSEKQACV